MNSIFVTVIASLDEVGQDTYSSLDLSFSIYKLVIGNFTFFLKML